jgi:hypothetical protein
MQRRQFFSLFRSGAILAWLAVLWGLAEPLERIEYINEKRRQLWEAAMTPGGHLAFFGFGILWLTALFFWPELKKRFPELPKTIHQRVEEMESEHPKMAQKHIDTGRRIDGVEVYTNGKFTRIEAGWSMVANRLEIVEGKVGVLDNSSQDALVKLNQDRPWIEELQKNIRALHASREYVMGGLEQFSVFQADLSLLIAECSGCIERLDWIQQLKLSHAATERPFSKPWWHNDNRDTGVPQEIIDWATLVVRHAAHCRKFAADNKIGDSFVIEPRMAAVSIQWDSDIKMSGALGILASQRALLIKARCDHAAKFSASTLMATTS